MSTTLVVKMLPNDHGNPGGRLADAELHFSGGDLDGLKLIGFRIWERRGGTGPEAHAVFEQEAAHAS